MDHINEWGVLPVWLKVFDLMICCVFWTYLENNRVLLRIWQNFSLVYTQYDNCRQKYYIYLSIWYFVKFKLKV